MSTPIVYRRMIPLLSLALLLSVLIGVVGPVAAQGDAQSLTVLSSNIETYPTVHFTARVSDADGFSILGLTGEHFAIGEDRALMPQAAVASQPLDLVVVFDRTPIGSDEINMYKAMATKFAALYQEGDHIWFMQPGSDPISIINAATLTDFTNSMVFSGSTRSRDINTALDRAVSLLLPDQQTHGDVHIVFIASYTVNSPEFAYTSAIPLHVIQLYQTGTNRANFTEKLRPLATGRFYAVTQTENPEILQFISALRDSRTVYDVTYESRMAQVGVRSIPVSVGGATGLLQFEKDVVAPLVTITSSESNFKIERNQFNDKNDVNAEGVNFDKPSERLTVQVTFPDGVDRNITEATLFVDEVAQTPEIITFNVATNQFDLNWDLKSYTTTAVHTLRVEVLDDFGAKGISGDVKADVNVTVVIPTIIAMTEVTGTPLPGGGTMTPTVVFALYGLLIGLVILAVAIIFWQRQFIGAGLQSVGKSMIYGMEEIGRKTSIAFGRTTDFDASGDATNYRTGNNNMMGGRSDVVGRGPTEFEGGSTNLGGKTDLEGDTVPPTQGMGQELAIFNVTSDAGTGMREIVMRNPKMTLGRTRDAGVDEVIRYPKISQIHCLVEYDHHEKAFYIRDEKTTNGTFVNGRRLAPKTREQLPPGATIRLGQAFEMRFQPNARVLQGQRPANQDSPRRTVSTRVELMEGGTPNAPRAPQQPPVPQQGYMPPPNGGSWPPPTNGDAFPPYGGDPYMGETRLAPPTNFSPDQPKPNSGPAKPKTPPAKPNNGSTKKDEWLD